VNESFQLTAAGTRDGFLVLSCLKRCAPYRVIELGSVPELLLVSESWGFVVVSGKRHGNSHENVLSVYTVNGVLVRECVLTSRIQAWTTWSSVSGFDYLLVASDDGQLRCCELFFLDFAPVLGVSLSAGVCAVRFVKEEQAIALVTDNGEFTIVPFSHE
jgi:hypothetical protein